MAAEYRLPNGRDGMIVRSYDTCRLGRHYLEAAPPGSPRRSLPAPRQGWARLVLNQINPHLINKLRVPDWNIGHMPYRD